MFQTLERLNLSFKPKLEMIKMALLVIHLAVALGLTIALVVIIGTANVD
jgi:hypothetical protein